jgi:hypothetical protein
MESIDEETECASEYPIDTESLTKGSRVAAEVIERAFNVKRGTDAYQMAAMRAQQHIARRFLDRGEIVTVTQRKHDLVILTDEEVPAHNSRLFRNDIKKAARAHARQLGADRSLMTEETLKLHDRTLSVQGAQLAAVSRVRREFSPSPRTRTTPPTLGAGKPDDV